MVKKKNYIIIYEKDIKLNLILSEQISKADNYEVYSVTSTIKLLELLEQKKYNALIFNLDNLKDEIETSIYNHAKRKNTSHILGYCNEGYNQNRVSEIARKILIKPFKIVHLVSEIEKLISSKTFKNSDIFLMNTLKFLPYEKVLVNLETTNKEHLTEKENKLLFYLCSNKNTLMTKNDLLTSIWGVSESINTHTLETHIYRLKQKLNKLEPNPSFLLSNNNGLYSFQF